MAERRYGFRFNGLEGGLLLAGVLLASFLIFVSGVYVGREVAGRKGVAQGQVVRVPVSPSGDQMIAKLTVTNDPASARTAVANTPMTWPVAREKIVPPTPTTTTTKLEELQQPEKERVDSIPARVSTSVAPTTSQRASSTTTVKEEHVLPRTKAMPEPFTPKLPIAVANRVEKPVTPQSTRVETKAPLAQASRSIPEERKSIPQNQRTDVAEKKPATVTVATAEKLELPNRPRVATTDGKRIGDDKNNESPLRSRSAAAEEKRASEEKNNEAKSVIATAKKPIKPMAGWRVQVGATTYQETAHDMARELRELGYDPMVSKVQMNGETLYRVRIGKFGKQGEAVAAVGRFRREGRFSQAYLVSE